jgi:CcmD family protein
MIIMRTRLVRWVRATMVGVCLCATLGAGTLAAQQPPSPAKPPAATDEFVPIDQIPEHDKLPAAPFLIGAYAVAWLAVLIYLFSLWRRLDRVEEELKRLKSS